MVRCIEEDAGQTAIVMFQLDENDLRAACTHRLHMFGSDGLPRPGTKPHPRAYGTFPRVAGRLRAEGWFPLEDAVRRMTSTAAQRFASATAAWYDREWLRTSSCSRTASRTAPRSIRQPSFQSVCAMSGWRERRS